MKEVSTVSLSPFYTQSTFFQVHLGVAPQDILLRKPAPPKPSKQCLAPFFFEIL